MSSTSSDKIRKVRIYTRTGDRGFSSLLGGERRSKDHPIFSTLGDIDELNASLGVAKEYCKKEHEGESEDVFVITNQIEEIQSRLLDIGTCVASSLMGVPNTIDFGTHVKDLETWIDEMDEVLPPLRNFILPSGGISSTNFHLSRTICRRVERSFVNMIISTTVSPTRDDLGGLLQYINRLSDYLFVLARTCSHLNGDEDKIYKRESK